MGLYDGMQVSMCPLSPLDRALSSQGWLQIRLGLELMILLSVPSHCWARHATPCLVYVVLGTEPRASLILDMFSTN